MSNRAASVLLTAVLTIVAAMPAVAQSTDEGSVFDFSLPGARSRAMGGAFVAIADDASTVYSNPAGLTSLFRPELSIEMRSSRLRYQAIDHGHAFGSPSNIGVDTIAGPRDKLFKETLTSPAFFSGVYPSGKWAIGLFHHQLVNYRMQHQTEGVFFDCTGGIRGQPGSPPFCELADGVDRLFPTKQEYEVLITGTGVGAAFQVTDRFRIGVSMQMFAFNIQKVAFFYNARRAHQFAPADMSKENLETASFRQGRDRKAGMNVGVLWDITSALTLGATFRQGQTFRYSAYNVSGPENPPGGTVYTNLCAESGDAPSEDCLEKVPFRVPDTWAAGVAFKPNNSWRIGLEYDWVRYGQLGATVNTTLPEGWPEAMLAKQLIKVDDASQLRLGGEYSRPISGASLLSVRVGVWTDPFHQPYLEPDDPVSGLPLPRWSLQFPKREGQVHYSGGVGFATARRWQVDLAVDHAGSITIFSLSSIVRF